MKYLNSAKIVLHGVKANIDHRYWLYTENFANKRFTKIMKSL